MILQSITTNPQLSQFPGLPLRIIFIIIIFLIATSQNSGKWPLWFHWAQHNVLKFIFCPNNSAKPLYYNVGGKSAIPHIWEAATIKSCKLIITSSGPFITKTKHSKLYTGSILVQGNCIGLHNIVQLLVLLC